MGVKMCPICGKRKARVPVTIKPSIGAEQDTEMCIICVTKYMKIRERFLVKAYQELLDTTKKVEK